MSEIKLHWSEIALKYCYFNWNCTRYIEYRIILTSISSSPTGNGRWERSIYQLNHRKLPIHQMFIAVCFLFVLRFEWILTSLFVHRFEFSWVNSVSHSSDSIDNSFILFHSAIVNKTVIILCISGNSKIVSLRFKKNVEIEFNFTMHINRIQWFFKK